MPRLARIAPGGMVFHVLNRGVGRQTLFHNADAYDAFERVIIDTLQKRPLRICGYCLMPNHWHFLVWPQSGRDVSRFMHRLTTVHAQNWQKFHGKVGLGHVYQSRFKSFPVQTNDYYYQALRYIEGNPLRAGLVQRAQEWQWSSLWRQENAALGRDTILSDWPLPVPSNWEQLVNEIQPEQHLDPIRTSIRRSRPLGDADWVQQVETRKRGTVPLLNLPGSGTVPVISPP